VVKSAFELKWNAQLPAGQPQLLTGRSWSGNGRISHTEVSTDGGQTWRPAVPYNSGGYLFGAVVRHPVTVT
jgi:hypothetical protein